MAKIKKVGIDIDKKLALVLVDSCLMSDGMVRYDTF